MARSTKATWLEGPGDLKTEEIKDVPVKGQSVLVRGLPAAYSAEVSSQMKMTQEGRDQVARVDVAAMEVLQFAHGVIEPEFSEDDARQVAQKYGPAFKKIVAKIDLLSGIDKEAIENAQARFPGSGEGKDGAGVGDGTPAGGK